jgi:ferredoxin
MKILYFTGTGNSLAVAKRIGGELLSIPQEICKKEVTYADDAIGLIFPEYYGSLPKMVGYFIERAKFETDYLFAVATCGSGAGMVLSDLQKIAEAHNIQFDYLNTLVMVDNFLPVFDIESEIKKLPEKRTEENLSQIVDDIKKRKEYIPSISLKAKAMAPLMKKMLQNKVEEYSAQGFVVSDGCTLCGICAKVCPTANISVSEKITFSDKCESCYACVHACPQTAIHLKKEKSDKRFRNPEVSLQEIITANNQLK